MLILMVLYHFRTMDTDNHFNMQYTSQVLTRNSNNLSNFNNSTSVEIPTGNNIKTSFLFDENQFIQITFM